VAIKEAKVPRSFPDRPDHIEHRSDVGRAAATPHILRKHGRRGLATGARPGIDQTTRYRRHRSPRRRPRRPVLPVWEWLPVSLGAGSYGVEATTPRRRGFHHHASVRQ
jgi:hypothetical protein